MEIKRTEIVGSLESNDLLVTIRPAAATEPEVIVESIVGRQYGEMIRRVAREVLSRCQATHCSVQIQDRGALDSVITARLEAAVGRAGEA